MITLLRIITLKFINPNMTTNIKNILESIEISADINVENIIYTQLNIDIKIDGII